MAKALLLNFATHETANTVTRLTVKKMATKLGFNETQLIQYALAKLRHEVLPYEADGQEVPDAMIEHLREREPQTDYRPTSTLFAGL